jgi:hypothetical protein
MNLAYGPQLLVVYFGSPTCGYCTQPAFKAALRHLGPLLEGQATASGRRLHLAAVAVEWDALAGVEYLRELGRFDEVIAGAKWLNTVVAQRLFSIGRPSVPTILLYERTITPSVATNTLVFSPERELARFVGSRAIEEWVARGAPVADALRVERSDSSVAAT